MLKYQIHDYTCRKVSTIHCNFKDIWYFTNSLFILKYNNYYGEMNDLQNMCSRIANLNNYFTDEVRSHNNFLYST